MRHSDPNARPNRSDPGPVDRSPASLPSQMLPIYRPQRLEGAHFRYQRGPLNAHSHRWGRGLVQHVFHLPARIPAGSPRGQIVRRAAKRKTLFIIRPCPNRAHPASSSRPARRTRIRRRRAAGAPAATARAGGRSAARPTAGAAGGAIRPTICSPIRCAGSRRRSRPGRCCRCPRWHGFPPPGGGTDGRRMPEASLPPMTRISVIAGGRLFLHQAPGQGRVVLSQFEQRFRSVLVAHQQGGSPVVLRPLP